MKTETVSFKKVIKVFIESMLLFLFNMPCLLVIFLFEFLFDKLKLYKYNLNFYRESDYKLCRKMIELSEEIDEKKKVFAENESEVDWLQYRVGKLSCKILRNISIYSLITYSFIIVALIILL